MSSTSTDQQAGTLSRVDSAILVLLVTVIAYCAAFAYDAAYLSHFGLPAELAVNRRARVTRSQRENWPARETVPCGNRWIIPETRLVRVGRRVVVNAGQFSMPVNRVNS